MHISNNFWIEKLGKIKKIGEIGKLCSEKPDLKNFV